MVAESHGPAPPSVHGRGMASTMISIKQLLERYDSGSRKDERQAAATRLRELLVVGLQSRHEANWGITVDFTLGAREILNRLEGEMPLGALVDTACETLELLESHSRQATEFFHGQSLQMQSMVAMLTETIADISAQSDASVATLQAVERRIQHASSLDDIRALKSSLANCLAAVKEATIHQRSAMQATLKRLHDQVKISSPARVEPAASPYAGIPRVEERPDAEYVVCFKLQRAEHVLARFGDGAIVKMLALVETGLKPALRPRDRLMRWKGASVLMFVSTREELPALRQRFSRIVSGIGQQHVEVGKNSALLAVGVDWIVLPQAQYSSLDSLFLDVDAFLGDKPKEVA